MMDSPFKSGSKEKEKNSSSSTGDDHHCPFSSLASSPNMWGSKVLFTQNCAAVSLSPTSRLNTSKRAHKKTTNSHGKKREKNNKRSHGISAEAERHAFRTSSRKVGQRKRDPGPSKLGRHRRLLCACHAFQTAPVPPEGRGPAGCDARRKELLQREPTKQILAYCGCQVGRPTAFPRRYRSAAHARLFTYPVVPQEAFPQESSNAVDA
ncbi:hypothetical protein TcCL_NonESM02992 [Trypanosoma cruzi]|nr:hypothetical protein TcCL_NonESM02992 [Trypanosoma cruzi]